MTHLLVILAFYYAQISAGHTDPITLRDYIVTEALVVGVDPQLAQTIVDKESGFNPNAVGDQGTSYGLWQIHLPAHTSLNAQNAQNIIFSTQWAMRELKDGNCRIWSTCPLNGS